MNSCLLHCDAATAAPSTARTSRTAVLAALGVRVLALLAGLLSVAAPAIADLSDVIEQIKPSVVVVGTYQRTRSPQFMMRGTGFVVGDGRHVATNAHVVPDKIDEAAGEVLVILARPPGSSVQQRAARSVALDKMHDLTLLRVDGQALPALKLHDSGKVREGQSVAFTGFPIGAVLGLSPVTHRGIISAVTPIVLPGPNARQLDARVIQRLRRGSFDIYQLDATAYPGNSGGPLYEVVHGEVVGIINMVFVKETKEAVLSKPSGISFAIPVEFLRDLMQEANQ
ncbi:MAG: trypsin-like peptidase domain-containing protein [Candidatus Accumulibacter sp.]|uniref:S1C family serine protease n=1 Tax=Accumulibacter sp. TaxID=2053492 RepID=UPI0025E98983|nr:serine protease [Accumulibacter sp.]MCP5249841.1 trypsin-like peptidase domain-containing protein [Accumulibacter sp.]